MKDKKKIYILFTILGVVLLALLILVLIKVNNEDGNSIKINGLSVNYEVSPNMSSTVFTSSVNKEDGLSKKVNMQVTNKSLAPSCVSLYVQPIKVPDDILNEDLKYAVIQNNMILSTGNFANKKLSQEFKITGDITTTISNSEYIVYIWLANSEMYNGKTYDVLFNLKVKKENCLNTANSPSISEGMIPVVWNDGVLEKADVSNSNNNWYSYEDKLWANVVLVKEGKSNEEGSMSRSEYKNAIAGTKILESDVLVYLVWIPRYKYKLFNVNSENISEQEINVEFQSIDDVKEMGINNDEWRTHPAFTKVNNGNLEELSGIWIGKFELGGTIDLPLIKNDTVSMVNKNIAEFNSIIKEFYDENYGFTNDDNVHMIKNIEWGAMAYLSQSKYGKCTNGGCGDIGINNTYDAYKKQLLTGCGNKSETIWSSTCYKYDTQFGTLATTTTNITGIYDTSGGAWEYVMGVMKDKNNNIISGLSGVNIDSNECGSIIDCYSYGNSNNDISSYSRLILGDATGETNGWYKDSSYFVYEANNNVWFRRGGDYGSSYAAGIFSYGTLDGKGYSTVGTRIVVN
ncbi:MAG: hypothetical protein Q4G04_03410 [bacterium]|nr:hypothetical protein [bacterium]